MTTAELTREITFEPATGTVGAWVAESDLGTAPAG